MPLSVAMLSESAAFYIAAFIALLNLFQWTYGVSVMTGKNENHGFVQGAFFLAD